MSAHDLRASPSSLYEPDGCDPAEFVVFSTEPACQEHCVAANMLIGYDLFGPMDDDMLRVPVRVTARIRDVVPGAVIEVVRIMPNMKSVTAYCVSEFDMPDLLARLLVFGDRISRFSAADTIITVRCSRFKLPPNVIVVVTRSDDLYSPTTPFDRVSVIATLGMPSRRLAEYWHLNGVKPAVGDSLVFVVLVPGLEGLLRRTSCDFLPTRVEVTSLLTRLSESEKALKLAVAIKYACGAMRTVSGASGAAEGFSS